MRLNGLRFLSAVFIATAVHYVETSRAVSDLVEELLNATRYNRRTRPAADRGIPLDIFININVNDISSISEVSMEYSMTLYLRQMWRDERLAYTSYNRSITLNHNQFDRLWTPDVFVRNLKAGVFHTITVPNRLIRLWPNGTILYSQRLTLTLACDMVLDKYPMDNQTCKIEFGSYAYTTEDLVFKWREDALPVEMSQAINLPEYVITGITHLVCSTSFSSTGSFPCLSAFFHLNRRLRAYILTTYLPSFLVVLLSWLSFWIDLESAPARTSLSILTILTITTQSSGLLRSMPAGSFTKAIDIWMATCLVFVFGAFIEYSIVNTLSRRQKAKSMKQAATKSSKKPPEKIVFKCSSCLCEAKEATKNGWTDDQQPSNTGPRQRNLSSEEGVGGGGGTGRDGDGGEKARKVADPCFSESKEVFAVAVTADVATASTAKKFCLTQLSKNKAVTVEIVSRVLFPIMFLVFNLIYWPMYLC